jgi:alkylation response protein AidB-like acyl-CoA dehydrogenase
VDLSLPESERLLAESVRSFVKRSVTTEALVELQGSTSGVRKDWWIAMADAGWLGALVPEELGGSGATCQQTAVICEELGRGPVPGPFLVSSVLAASLLRHAAQSATRDELLAGIATGDVTVCPVVESHGDPLGCAVTSSRLSATIPFVPYAREATYLLVPVAAESPGDDPAFAIINAKSDGVTARELPGFLAWNDEVTFENVTVTEELIVSSPGEWSQALAEAYVLIASYVVGGCQVLLERSVEYSNTRVQFGKPVGKFQRVQDHIVDLVNALDAVRWSTYYAIWHIDAGIDARAAAHMAKAVAAESYITCTNQAHKVHGGIGVDPEYGITLFTQMARSLYAYLGNPLWHKRQMADALGWGRAC